jgi:hypothetical protein
LRVVHEIMLKVRLSEKTLALGSSVNRGNGSHFGANPPPRIAPRLIYVLLSVWYICD